VLALNVIISDRQPNTINQKERHDLSHHFGINAAMIIMMARMIMAMIALVYRWRRSYLSPSVEK